MTCIFISHGTTQSAPTSEENDDEHNDRGVTDDVHILFTRHVKTMVFQNACATAEMSSPKVLPPSDQIVIGCSNCHWVSSCRTS